MPDFRQRPNRIINPNAPKTFTGVLFFRFFMTDSSLAIKYNAMPINGTTRMVMLWAKIISLIGKFPKMMAMIAPMAMTRAITSHRAAVNAIAQGSASSRRIPGSEYQDAGSVVTRDVPEGVRCVADHHRPAKLHNPQGHGHENGQHIALKAEGRILGIGTTGTAAASATASTAARPTHTSSRWPAAGRTNPR